MSDTKGDISMAYDNITIVPTTLPNITDMKWISSSLSTTLLDATHGTDLPALSGYILVNAGSAMSAVSVEFKLGTAVVSTLTVSNGAYQGFYVAGADFVDIVSGNTAAASGEFNFALNNNPF